jgi:hypothetical protein
MTEKSKLLTALATVNTSENAPKESGGLKTALARKTATALTGGPQTTNLTAVHKAVLSSSNTVVAAMKDDAQARKDLKGIAFVIDATGSRELSWREAQVTQNKMFDALKSVDELEVGIICHLGNTVNALGWFKDPVQAKQRMADVSCATGQTKVVDSLRQAIAGHDGHSPSSIIMVGDCFEENFDALTSVCREIKDKRIKLYAFLDGNDPTGESAFKLAAELTNGVFKRFGDDLSLTDLCVAAAVQDSGNVEAFKKLLASNHKGALALQGSTNRLLLSGNASPSPKR